ncbi:MAG: sodium/solute symporter [Bacteroidales bacterium]
MNRTFSNTTHTLLLCLLLILIPLRVNGAGQGSEMENIIWENTQKLPTLNSAIENPGVAGAFAGIINDKLIVVGGANFPFGPPWENGVKTWHKTIYDIDLSDADATWKISYSLIEKPVAYGVSIPVRGGLLCIGGNDSTECFRDVFLISEVKGELVIDSKWPPLPVPLSHATGNIIGDKIYIAGGQESMLDPQATNHFFTLSLSEKEKGWKKLKSWPGAARSFAVSAVQSDGFDKCFYLFSGRNYHGDMVEVLQDGYAYNPRLDKWSKLEGSFPVMAGTAMATGCNHILFFGGVPELSPASAHHPGFDDSIRVYHTITNTLFAKGKSPYTLPVTTTLVKDENVFYLVSGEIKPGIRTPDILKGDIEEVKTGLGFLNTLVIILYFASLAGIGWYFSRKQKNTDDYFKGGGRLPWWAVGLSIFGTTLSAITFMAIPAKAYASDWSYLMMNAGIIMVLPIIIKLFLPFYRKLNITTAYEYLGRRFNDTIRVICSFIFILFQIGRMGIVMFLPAIALNVVTGFDIYFCIAVMGILSLLYTMMGGIEAVVWTDALQVVVLLGGAILVIIIAISELPFGIGGVIERAYEQGKFSLGSMALDWKQSTFWTVIVATFFTNITTYGTDQTIVQRYLTTKTEKEARKSILTNAVMTIPATILFFFAGTILYVYYQQLPANLSLSINDGDAILPWYIFSRLPNGVSGLLISGIFAAAMSTLSSSMNSAATAYVVDIHTRFFSQSEFSLKTARYATFILGGAGILFAYMMATWEIKSMWDEFNKILGLILGSLGGLFLLGMLTKRANSTGALAGMAGSVVIQLLLVKLQTVHLLLYSATGLLSCFIIGYVVSLLVRQPNEEVNVSER